MEHYGLEVYCYDKLLVAFQVGGSSGLHDELNKISSRNNHKKEEALARAFQEKLPSLKDPQSWLSDRVARDRARINLVMNLRMAAMSVIFLVFCARFFLRKRSLP